MYLSARRDAITIPEYSLTGDLLSFMRCHRQYRYQNGSSLPPARPVQLWFGEFVHGVMEMAYTMWEAKKYPLPWPSTPIEWNARLEPSTLRENDIGELGRRVENTLAVQGKSARNAAARQSAYSRVTAAINLIGPHLFPLVAFAEEPLTGSRSLPRAGEGQELRARRYGLTGVADVLTEITMNTVATDNLIRAAIEGELRKHGLTTPESYEVIVDYKGAARPDPDEDYWKQHDWQVQTYAWLRSRKAAAKPVVAGILLYVNELLPGPDDMRQMAHSFHKGTLDIAPAPGTADFNTLNLWRDGVAGAPNLSAAFRIQRSLRVIPVTEDSQALALAEFDKVVLDIESNVTKEVRASNISEAWTPNCRDAATCVACDFKSFCPSPADAGRDFVIRPPVAP